MNSPDVIILGGGPAGISAMLWCRSLNLRAILLETAPQLGGQMLMMYHQIPDYPGLPLMTGVEMRDRFEAHLREVGATWRTGCRIEEIDLAGRTLRVDGEQLSAGALIIATGARKRLLGVPGEALFAARGVSFSATKDHSLYAGRPVCVIGGGDSAVENATILSAVCPSVTLIHRSERFRARAEWLSEARRRDNITFLPNTEVISIEGRDRAERVIVRDRTSGRQFPLETDCVFVKIGIAPNVEAFGSQLPFDQDGYITVDNRQRTAIDRVYAAGDVTNPVCLSVATSVGHGAIAAKDIAQRMITERPAK